MSDPATYSLTPVGFIRSSLKHREDAPKQGAEGAPDAWLEMAATVVEGLEGIAIGQEIILIT
jgi:tRNA (Thr-GGU) A37 N-methylase